MNMSILQDKHSLTSSHSQNIENILVDSTKNQVSSRFIVPVKRSACVFAHFNFSNLSQSLKQKSLSIQLKKISPFKNFEQYVIWVENDAMVWIWQSSENNLKTKQIKDKIKYIPETILTGSRQKDLIELTKLSTGVEGRIWKNSLLIGSRFWTKEPELHEWNLFLRTHGLKPMAELPKSQPYTLLKEPWYKPTIYQEIFTWIKIIHPLWYISYAAIAVLSFQLTSIVQLSQVNNSLQRQYEQSLQSANEIVTARELAFDSRKSIHQLQQLSPWPMSLKTLADSLQLITDMDATINRWSFNNGELTLDINAKTPDPKLFVEKFESSPFFEDVRINNQTRNSNISLILKVKQKIDYNKFSLDAEEASQE